FSSRGILAVYFIKDRLDFQVVVGFRRGYAGGDILGGVVDFRREQVVQTLSRRTIQQLVRWVLVGPRCASQAAALDNFEDSVDSQELVRKNRSTVVSWVARQRVGIDPAAGVESRQVLIDRLVINNLGAGKDTGRARAAHAAEGRTHRWSKFAIIAVVIIDSGRLWRAPGTQRNHARHCIRWL